MGRESKTYTAAELAPKIGVSRAVVDKWAREGCPFVKPKKGPRRFDLDAVQAWRDENGRDGKVGRPSRLSRLKAKTKPTHGRPGSKGPPKDTPPEITDDVDALLKKEALSKAKKAWWDAKKVQVQTLREQGKLVEREEVERGRLERIHATAAVMEALPDRWARRFVNVDEATAESLLRDLFAEVRAEFAKEPSE